MATSTKTPGAFHSITPGRTPSQATSVKAEPGSNVAPSEASKKEVADSPIPSDLGEGGYSSTQPANPTNNKVSPELEKLCMLASCSHCSHPLVPYFMFLTSCSQLH